MPAPLPTAMANPKPEGSLAPRRSRDCKLEPSSPLTHTPRDLVILFIEYPRSSSTQPANHCHSEDGTLEGGRGSLAAHKLGPKANQGAINAGLRALDRSGKPCRKWSRGGFKLKSFTGVVWEIPRWTAPPKPQPESSGEGSTPASVDSSNKENKEDASQLKSEASHNGGDIDMQSAPSFVDVNSPAPVPVAAA